MLGGVWGASYLSMILFGMGREPSSVNRFMLWGGESHDCLAKWLQVIPRDSTVFNVGPTTTLILPPMSFSIVHFYLEGGGDVSVAGL